MLKIKNVVYPGVQNGQQGNKVNQTKKEISGFITQPDGTSGDLMVKLDPFPAAAEYTVLDTNYKDYSIVYSCSHFFGVGIQEFLWVFSRSPLEKSSKYFKALETRIKTILDIKFKNINYPMYERQEGYRKPNKYSDTEEFLQAV